MEATRYLHFHDFKNSVLLIGTHSGTLYAWNGLKLESSVTNKPVLLATLN